MVANSVSGLIPSFVVHKLLLYLMSSRGSAPLTLLISHDFSTLCRRRGHYLLGLFLYAFSTARRIVIPKTAMTK